MRCTKSSIDIKWMIHLKSQMILVVLNDRGVLKCEYETQKALYLQWNLLLYASVCVWFALWIMLLHPSKILTTKQRCLFITLHFFFKYACAREHSMSPIHCVALEVGISRNKTTLFLCIFLLLKLIMQFNALYAGMPISDTMHWIVGKYS